MKTGKDNVIIGKLPSGSEIGDRNVVITAADERGNVVFNTPGAIGYGATAGAGSIAIGAFANAGANSLQFPDQIKAELLGLVETAIQHQNADVYAALQQISNELQKPAPQASVIHQAWAGVQQLATIDGASSLLSKGAVALFSYLSA
ncbi:MAG TPA: hypothetical protein VGE36_13755 [Roseateles sp.]